jgi:mono/diheme cytochrome c family protein
MSTGVPSTPDNRAGVWRVGICLLVAVWVGAVSVQRGHVEAASPAPQSAALASSQTQSGEYASLFSKYCLTCHTERMKSLGTVPIALETLDLSDIAAHAETWELVVRKTGAGLMPPAGAPRPDKRTQDAFVAWLESELDRIAATSPNPGRSEPFHRLNRTEYRNAIRDLLDLDVDVSSLLPADDASYGFDNIAGVLRMSPTLMERYLSAAQRVSRLAIGTPPPFPNIDYFRVTDDLSQEGHLPGLPFGTRGGTLIPYVFPMDAEYVISVRLTRDLNEGVPLYLEPQPLEISVDGERVGLFTLPGVTPPPPPAPRPQAPGSPSEGGAQPQRPAISQIEQGIRISGADRQARNRADDTWDLRVPVKAGQREIAVTFLNRVPALTETVRLPFLRPYPAGVNIPETRQGAYLRSVEISGPYDPSGPGNSPSRQRVFVCRPEPGASVDEQATCARSILAPLARRAYRRPIADNDLEPLMAFYREGRDESGFDAGIERALRRLLVSPEFLLRVERDPADVTAGAPYRVTDLELASRLSFFLWSSIPDDELLELAERRQLRNPDVLAAQVRRMLADDRAGAFVMNFAGQWLFLRNVPAVGPVQGVFPDFDDTLRQAFRRETELFFESIVREDRSALDLLRADYTFLNERLAQHYGIPNIKGSHFRRVELGQDSVRAGLLGHGSILTVTSYPNRTSPVLRGKWILENLLGTPPPPPIPNVGELQPTTPSGDVLSMREQMQRHRTNPVCAGCHSMMDPLGFSLENFDAVGKWRTLDDSSTVIDPSGVMPDGTAFEGPAGLREALLRSNRVVVTLTEKMMTYALGRGLEYYDAPAVRTIVRDAAADDYRFSSLILGVVQSAPFQMRRPVDQTDAAGRVAGRDDSHRDRTRRVRPS